MNRLAPWWAYLVPFLAINYARALLVDTSGAGDIALALAAAAAGLRDRHGAAPRTDVLKRENRLAGGLRLSSAGRRDL